MNSPSTSPIISVIIPTNNRAELLEAALQSFARQRMSADDFEVVVVDDGSVDDTPAVCRRFCAELPLKYDRLGKVGISTAKNLGLFASTGVLTLFFDDDDVADANLLLEHVSAHQRHPEEYIAVLGYTTWAPSLRVTEVMHYITEVGQMMFSYPSFHDGELLGFTKFYGGRTSCKRAFLTRCGVFDQHMPGMEDFELGYRLSRAGLRVLFHRSARSYMNRAVTYDEFCKRCEKQGRYRWLFSRIHSDPALQEPLGIENAEARWLDTKPLLSGQVERVHALEALLEAPTDEAHVARFRSELHALYRASFRAYFLKGTVEAMEADGMTMPADGQPILSSGPVQ